jgi:hypothetical protein
MSTGRQPKASEGVETMSINRWMCSTVLAMVVASSLYAEESSAKKWQDRVDKAKRSVLDELAGSVIGALQTYEENCEIHMIFSPPGLNTPPDNEMTFTFVRDRKDLLVLKGHRYSVFRTANGVIFFADFSPYSAGCAVASYDLNTGRKLWCRRLKGLGPVEHSIYNNRVSMTLKNDAVWIDGYEDAGDYIEVLDRKTGKCLAHRIVDQKTGSH